MSPEQRALVQTSWNTISSMGEGVAYIFYQRLFATTPAARDMFAHVDPATQVKKLIAALNTVVNGLYELETLVPALTALGKRHVSYGVEDEQYDAAGAALLWTLETVFGPRWTSDLKLAWSEAYSIVAHVMREAARSPGTNIGGIAATS